MIVHIKITDEQIANLIVSAFEGGSNYWYQTVNQKKPTRGNVTVKSLEEPERTPRNLDRAAILRGLQLMADEQPGTLADVLTDNGDSTTGDVFLQLALYGEVLYG